MRSQHVRRPPLPPFLPDVATPGRVSDGESNDKGDGDGDGDAEDGGASALLGGVSSTTGVSVRLLPTITLNASLCRCKPPTTLATLSPRTSLTPVRSPDPSTITAIRTAIGPSSFRILPTRNENRSEEEKMSVGMSVGSQTFRLSPGRALPSKLAGSHHPQQQSSCMAIGKTPEILEYV
ncbi:hypothetical protein D9756_007037 [Leucocoprinus leucothites]|uniref:Uncharacterized protein n=1 Tax=Leucocoprinus leucothites TaxID=201217 RepID=A0A8H5D685_9AGAR|nr:hypothetical protein D9756_007037 [Leucoagaricus leucothites]